MSRRGRFGACGIVAALCWFAAAGVAWATPSGPGPGNSPNAHACQDGGWRQLTTSTGQPFSNEGECTSYAAKGGTLQPKATLTVSFSQGQVVVNGTGLQPGATVFLCVTDKCSPLIVGQVAPDGTFSGSRFLGCSSGSVPLVAESTTASGSTIVSSPFSTVC